MEMTVESVIASVISAVGAVGGLEAIKYFMNRDSEHRKHEAQADKEEIEVAKMEFEVLKQTVEFLQKQLQEKEQRFAEQTELVRKLNSNIIELTNKKSEVEILLNTYQCHVEHCPNRQPPNGY